MPQLGVPAAMRCQSAHCCRAGSVRWRRRCAEAHVPHAGPRLPPGRVRAAVQGPGQAGLQRRGCVLHSQGTPVARSPRRSAARQVFHAQCDVPSLLAFLTLLALPTRELLDFIGLMRAELAECARLAARAAHIAPASRLCGCGWLCRRSSCTSHSSSPTWTRPPIAWPCGRPGGPICMSPPAQASQRRGAAHCRAPTRRPARAHRAARVQPKNGARA